MDSVRHSQLIPLYDPTTNFDAPEKDYRSLDIQSNALSLDSTPDGLKRTPSSGQCG